MSDDEFVARAGELWVWIDRVWTVAAPAGVAVVMVLAWLGLPGWLAVLLGIALVAGLSWAVTERERHRRFPGEATA